MTKTVRVRLASVAVAATAVSAVAALGAPSLAAAAVGSGASVAQGAKAPKAPVAGAPTVSAPASVIVGNAMTVTIGGGTVAGGGAITGYDVDFGDGTGTVPYVAGMTHTYTTVGLKTITAVAHDGATPANTSPAGTATVNVVPVPVTNAVLSVSSLSGTFTPTQPFVVTLDGSKSTVAPGGTLTYAFTCGPTGPAPQPVAGTNAKATCAFTAVGSYAVSLTVSDGVTTSGPVTQTVVVGTPQPPNLGAFTVTPSTTTPLTALADFSKVTIDRNSTAPTFTVAWGDGTQNVYTSRKPNPAPSHSYPGVGQYFVQLTVDDGLGLPTSVSQTTVVVVIAAVPHAGATPVWRIAGADRYETGIKVSQFRWAAATDTTAPAAKHPGAVVLATGTNFPDALSGVPLAAKLNAGLLLTNTTLDPAVEAEIQRILPADGSHTVYILGGHNAISLAIEQRIAALNYKVVRLGGADRYETALLIAHQMGDPAHVIVARGDDFPDALSAGPLAADLFATGTGPSYQPAAIVLSKGTALDDLTRAYVEGKLGTSLSVLAVGGQASVAVAQLPGIVVSGPTQNVAGIAGQTRWETSAAVAQLLRGTNPNAPIGLATGFQFADALTGGAFMSESGGAILLTDPKNEAPATIAAVDAVAATTYEVDVFGGVNAVSQTVYDDTVAAVHGVPKSF